jgi:hypothetical protein
MAQQVPNLQNSRADATYVKMPRSISVTSYPSAVNLFDQPLMHGMSVNHQ